MGYKYYIFNNLEDAQTLLNILTTAWGENVPYTEIIPNQFETQWAIKENNFTVNNTNITSEYLPTDYLINE